MTLSIGHPTMSCIRTQPNIVTCHHNLIGVLSSTRNVQNVWSTSHMSSPLRRWNFSPLARRRPGPYAQKALIAHHRRRCGAPLPTTTTEMLHFVCTVYPLPYTSYVYVYGSYNQLNYAKINCPVAHCTTLNYGFLVQTSNIPHIRLKCHEPSS